ncbi:hypothetical protein [Streptomyces niveus]|uniref:hypothetical protein n=1 Tax=Streptomyces niveus TaxID=193462 RepID=UPI00363F4AB3
MRRAALCFGEYQLPADLVNERTRIINRVHAVLGTSVRRCPTRLSGEKAAAYTALS